MTEAERLLDIFERLPMLGQTQQKSLLVITKNPLNTSAGREPWVVAAAGMAGGQIGQQAGPGGFKYTFQGVVPDEQLSSMLNSSNNILTWTVA